MNDKSFAEMSEKFTHLDLDPVDLEEASVQLLISDIEYRRLKRWAESTLQDTLAQVYRADLHVTVTQRQAILGFKSSNKDQRRVHDKHYSAVWGNNPIGVLRLYRLYIREGKLMAQTSFSGTLAEQILICFGGGTKKNNEESKEKNRYLGEIEIGYFSRFGSLAKSQIDKIKRDFLSKNQYHDIRMNTESVVLVDPKSKEKEQQFRLLIRGKQVYFVKASAYLYFFHVSDNRNIDTSTLIEAAGNISEVVEKIQSLNEEGGPKTSAEVTGRPQEEKEEVKRVVKHQTKEDPEEDPIYDINKSLLKHAGQNTPSVDLREKIRKKRNHQIIDEEGWVWDVKDEEGELVELKSSAGKSTKKWKDYKSNKIYDLYFPDPKKKRFTKSKEVHEEDLINVESIEGVEDEEEMRKFNAHPSNPSYRDITIRQDVMPLAQSTPYVDHGDDESSFDDDSASQEVEDAYGETTVPYDPQLLRESEKVIKAFTSEEGSSTTEATLHVQLHQNLHGVPTKSGPSGKKGAEEIKRMFSSLYKEQLTQLESIMENEDLDEREKKGLILAVTDQAHANLDSSIKIEKSKMAMLEASQEEEEEEWLQPSHQQKKAKKEAKKEAKRQKEEMEDLRRQLDRSNKKLLDSEKENQELKKTRIASFNSDNKVTVKRLFNEDNKTSDPERKQKKANKPADENHYEDVLESPALRQPKNAEDIKRRNKDSSPIVHRAQFHRGENETPRTSRTRPRSGPESHSSSQHRESRHHRDGRGRGSRGGRRGGRRSRSPRTSDHELQIHVSREEEQEMKAHSTR